MADSLLIRKLRQAGLSARAAQLLAPRGRQGKAWILYNPPGTPALTAAFSSPVLDRDYDDVVVADGEIRQGLKLAGGRTKFEVMETGFYDVILSRNFVCKTALTAAVTPVGMFGLGIDPWDENKASSHGQVLRQAPVGSTGHLGTLSETLSGQWLEKGMDITMPVALYNGSATAFATNFAEVGTVTTFTAWRVG